MDFADVIGLINTNRGNGKKKNLDTDETIVD